MSGCVPPHAIDEAVFDDEALAALPTWLACAAGARSAMIQWRHLDGVHEVMAFSRREPACAALYAWKYAAIDPWVQAALAAARPGEMLCMHERVPLAAFERSRLYRELIRPRGDDTIHAAVAVFDTGWGDAIVSLHRGRREKPFVQSDLDALDAYLPDLGRVLRTRGELIAYRRREQVRRDSLDGVALASIVMRGDGQMVRVNLAGDQVLRPRRAPVLLRSRLAVAAAGGAGSGHRARQRHGYRHPGGTPARGFKGFPEAGPAARLYGLGHPHAERRRQTAGHAGVS
jgi:hypothetical protein